MSVRIEEDYDQVTGGFAVVNLPVRLEGADPAVRIRRVKGEPDRLGPHGWQATPADLRPAAAEDDASGGRLIFGPGICDYLEENRELELEVPALNWSARVIWPYISPSVHHDMAEGAVIGEPRTPRPEKPPAPPIGPPGGNGGGSGGKSGGEGGGDGGPQGPTPGGDDDDTNTTGGPDTGPGAGGDDEDEGRGTPRGGRSKLAWIVGGLALVAAAVALAWFLTQGGDPVADDDEQGTEVVEETGSQDESGGDVAQADPPGDAEPGGTGDAAPEPAAEETSAALLDQARECQSAGCPPEDLYEIGERLLALGDADAAYRVMTLASSKGHLPAQRWMARTYDPAHFDPDYGLAEPDPDQAGTLYRAAAEAGLEAAAEDLAAMCEGLAAVVDGGSPPEGFADIDAQRAADARDRHCR